jgi:hypothetical protein
LVVSVFKVNFSRSPCSARQSVAAASQLVGHGLVRGGRGGADRRETYDHTMTAIKDIIDSIEYRLRELDEEIGALNAARDVLVGHDSRAPRRRRAAVRSSETRTGPGNDASSAGRVQAAVGPGGPASSASPRRSRSRLRKSARRGTRAKAGRAVEVVPAGKLELLLSDTGGLATSAVAERADADRDQVLALLRELERAGRVRRTGQRRATRWHAITDEERIQERAAELAARSRSAA